MYVHNLKILRNRLPCKENTIGWKKKKLFCNPYKMYFELQQCTMRDVSRNVYKDINEQIFD